MPQHSAILRSPSHTPGLGTLGTNLVRWQIDVRDGRVCLQRLGQGLETETDQGWLLHPGFYRSNRDHWNPEKTWHLTLTRESLWYRTWKNNPEIHGFIQHLHTVYDIQLDWEYLTTQLDPRWTMKLQHLLTIQTSHCKRMSVEKKTSWHAAAFSDSAEPTTHQAFTPSSPIWLLDKRMSVTDPFIFSALAKAWRQRQIKVGILFVVLLSKPDHWNPTNNSHSTETYRISLIQNLEKQSRNPQFHSASTYSWIGSLWQLHSVRHERWNYSTCKPSKLLTVRGCPKHDIMTCRSIQRFCGAHPTHQALAPSAPIWFLYKLMFVMDAFVFSASAKAWKQETDQGWRLVRGPFGQTWFRKCSNKKAFNWDMSNLSDSKLGKTIQKSTVSFSIYIQLDRESLTTPLGPTWTMKLQHLQTIQTSHCQRKSKTWHHDMLQHSAEPTTHQALAPSAPIWLLSKSMSVTDAFIFSASAKAWRQRQIKVGISFVVSTVKTRSLKSHEQFTFNWDISNLSDSKLGKTIQKSTVSFSIYNLHTAGSGVFDNSTRSDMKDETTAPANHPNFSL